MKESLTPQDKFQPDSLRERIWRIIFQTESGMAKAFDVVLLIVIAGSVMIVMLESVAGIQANYSKLLKVLEWAFTILFTIEYRAL